MNRKIYFSISLIGLMLVIVFTTMWATPTFLPPATSTPTPLLSEVIFVPPSNTRILSVCVSTDQGKELFCDGSNLGAIKKNLPIGKYRYTYGVGPTSYQAKCPPEMKSVSGNASGIGTFEISQDTLQKTIHLGNLGDVLWCVPN